MKNRGHESTYDDCDVHTPAWASVEADYEKVEWPTRLSLEIEDGPFGTVYAETETRHGFTLGVGVLREISS